MDRVFFIPSIVKILKGANNGSENRGCTFLNFFFRIEISLKLEIFFMIWIFSLLPLYGYLILVYIFIFPYMSSGPFWFPHDSDAYQVKQCENKGWRNILFINDFLPKNFENSVSIVLKLFCWGDWGWVCV